VRRPLIDAQLVLRDGRRLAYCEWGDPDGTPVVLFHGAPGSRRMAPQPDVTGALGARLITFDRPGYGGSDAREGRELVDTPDDVVELLAEVGVDEFAVIGVSAGGGHALATAVRLRERVTGLALLGAPGPLDEVPGAWEALPPLYGPTARMARREPARSVRAMVRATERFVADPASFLGGGTPADRAVARDPEHGPMLLADAVEAFRTSGQGMADDLVALWRPWGFAVAEAPPGAWLCHGAEDTRAEPDFRWFAVTLPSAVPRIWPDQGHFGIVARWPDVLESVLRTS
jgi:pimeloyl-ACP methyl ester carboxylesterase